jgi:hypothetical protein
VNVLETLGNYASLLLYVAGLLLVLGLFFGGLKLIDHFIFKDRFNKTLPGKLPYLPKDSLMSDSELNAYRAITNVTNGKLLVFCKVGLKEFLFINGAKDYTHHFRRISQKHVDFLLCNPTTSKPVCGIEWDDSSHERPKVRERDEFVEQVYRDAGFPLLRFKTNTPLEDISKALIPYLETSPVQSVAPVCPKCLIPMVLRHAKKNGQPFWGCVNFPNCKMIHKA